VNGMRHGIGSYLYENGDRFEGKILKQLSYKIPLEKWQILLIP
jgi:hypothetical protein